MKRLVLVMVAVLVTVACMAQVDQIHYLDEATLEWDPVTTDFYGDPLLPEDVVSYEVFIYDYYAGVVDDQDPVQLIAMGEVSDPLLLMDFTGLQRSAFAAGVRAKVVDGQGGVTVSQIAWSYDPVATDPIQPFLYAPLGVLILPAPTGLRDSGM